MKKRSKPGKKGFDEKFDSGDVTVNFSKGVKTAGLSKAVRIPPMTIPAWLAAEIEGIAKFQANSKTSVIRQLLVEAIDAKKKSA